jgi:hypothetical protein
VLDDLEVPRQIVLQIPFEQELRRAGENVAGAVNRVVVGLLGQRLSA